MLHLENSGFKLVKVRMKFNRPLYYALPKPDTKATTEDTSTTPSNVAIIASEYCGVGTADSKRIGGESSDRGKS
jgi:hypothetical protein